MNLIEQLRATAKGKAILDDWLGDGGKPVLPERAEARADVCKDCPKNHKPKWWDLVAHAKDKVAEQIHKHIEAKNGLGMRVSCEDDLIYRSRCMLR